LFVDQQEFCSFQSQFAQPVPISMHRIPRDVESHENGLAARSHGLARARERIHSFKRRERRDIRDKKIWARGSSADLAEIHLIDPLTHRRRKEQDSGAFLSIVEPLEPRLWETVVSAPFNSP